MSAKLLIERDGGAVSTLPPTRKDMLLAGDSLGGIAWIERDASRIPYTSPTSGRIENVSRALDHLMQHYAEVDRTVAEVLIQARKIDAENDAVVQKVQSAVYDLDQRVSMVSTTVERHAHRPLSVSRSNNPALQFEPLGQTIRLDLTIAGSFDDSGAKIGSTSIQGALTRLAGLIGDLRNDYYRVFNEAVTLSNRLEDTERRLAILEAKAAETPA